MALMAGGLGVTFPPSMNVAVTNTPTVSVAGTVATAEVQRITLGQEKVYAVTTSSQSLPSADIPATCKGAEIQYLSENSTDRLYTRTDGVAVTAADARTTGLSVITLESLSDVQGFRFMGVAGTTIKVVYRGF